MRAIFLTADSAAIFESNDGLLRPPSISRSPNEEVGGTFQLVSLDAVLIDGQPEIVATYERIAPSLWEKALRPIEEKSETCPEQE